MRLSDTNASQVSTPATAAAAAGATNDAVAIDHSSFENPHAPSEPLKKPPRRSKWQSNHPSTQVVDLSAKDVDKSKHLPQ